ncbi:MAG: cobalamin-dependent protein [Anaerolineae bacterium]|nr:cobalamin-dependent protein [Anaerolineae bacterium]
MPSKTGKVLAGSLGDCVHVAGVTRFLAAAEEAGYETHFTGPATGLEAFMDAIVAHDPDVIGVSYRLTPDNARTLLTELRAMLQAAGVLGRARIFFGGTPPVAAIARELGYFDVIFSGEEPPHQVRLALEGKPIEPRDPDAFPQRAIERIRWKAPYPILRHHFGIPAPTIEPTVAGIAQIAEAGALDVISLGADQDAQEHFFHPRRQDLRSKGAGGVPFRTEDDLRRLYAASRRGNYPLLRSYSGTADHLRYADLLARTLDNAWCATSLFWFNAMDGRGPSPLAQSIAEHQALMAWHGARDIPVEGNESYHWGMRDAPDAVVCASAYLYAHNARHCGVRDYILTYMFPKPAAAFQRDGPGPRPGHCRAQRALRGGRLSHLAADAHRPAQLSGRPAPGARAPGAERHAADGPAPAHRPRGGLQRGRSRGQRRRSDRERGDGPGRDRDGAARQPRHDPRSGGAAPARRVDRRDRPAGGGHSRAGN